MIKNKTYLNVVYVKIVKIKLCNLIARLSSDLCNLYIIYLKSAVNLNV